MAEHQSHGHKEGGKVSERDHAPETKLHPDAQNDLNNARARHDALIGKAKELSVKLHALGDKLAGISRAPHEVVDPNKLGDLDGIDQVHIRALISDLHETQKRIEGRTKQS